MDGDETTAEPTPWWGTFTLEEETGGRWEVGPSTLWVYRTAREYRVVHRPSTDPKRADPMANRSRVTVPVNDEEMASVLDSEDNRLQISRYSFGETEPRVSLQPGLADRTVVARPEHPMHVPPGETITLYVSTPLWMRVVLPDSERLVQEVPSHRMSDTWFGRTTVEGEFCYATRTAGRLRRERLPQRLHRAVTPLEIENTAREQLLLERVQLPIPHLALYVTPQDVLWTQAVRMTRTEGREGADIQIRDGPPAEVGEAELVEPPRETTKKGLFTSTFSAVEALFGS